MGRAAFRVLQAIGGAALTPASLALIANAFPVVSSAPGRSASGARPQAQAPRSARSFRNPLFAGASALALIAYLAVAGFIFPNTLYLQQVRGYSPLAAGVLLAPATVAMLVVAPLSGRLTGRFGPRPPTAVASVLLMAGLLVLSTARQVGNVLGVALLGSIAYSALPAADGALQGAGDAFAAGMGHAYLVAAAFALAGLFIALFAMDDRPAPATQSEPA